MQPVLYLTIEIMNREFDSRLLMAAHALEAGLTVVVGQQWSIFQNLANFPPGVLVAKTVNAIQARSMAAAKACGHIVAATDEEVLAMAVADGFLKAFSPIAVEACDLFLAQSDQHKESIEQAFPQMRGKVAVTGNPRVDLMGPALRKKFDGEAQKIRDEVGPFVLFNTNYSYTNSVWGSLQGVANIAIQAGVLDPKKPETVEEFKQNVAFEVANRQAMAAMMNWTANHLASHRVVIRPHPGEKPEYWQQAANNHPRVRVVPRSHHIPWILASDMVVHTSCTTGLEAAIMGKPAINLSPAADSPWYRLYVMGKVNPIFPDWQKASEAVTAYFKSASGPIADNAPYRAELLRYFPNLASNDSAKKITKAFIDILAARGAKVGPAYQWSPLPQGYVRPERSAVQKDKMSATVEQVAATLQYLRDVEGLSRKIKLSLLDDSLFLVVPE